MHKPQGRIAQLGNSDPMGRRQFTRVRAQVETHYWLPGELPSQTKSAWSQDISDGGICLSLTESLSMGQEIRLTLPQGFKEAEWSEITGTVIWQGDATGLEGKTGPTRPTGIFFSNIDTVTSNRIRQWLAVQMIDSATGEVSLKELEAELVTKARVSSAYDGSTVTYRVLRAFGWGPLNNLGYFQFPSPFSALNLFLNAILFKTSSLLPEAQMKLVIKAVKLLAIQKSDEILEIACGRGRGSFIMASFYPESHVTSIDLLPENIQAASALYRTDNLEFSVGDAMNLKFQGKSFNKILCLEAAFHFPNRSKFLREAYGVLQEGGRLVVVDFMWKTDDDRKILEDEETRLVRDTWKWEDFFSIGQYLAAARSAGFEIEARNKWSRRVIDPLEFVFKTVAWLGLRRWGRSLLLRLNPLLSGIKDDEWGAFWEAANAHDHVRAHIEYIALVLRKP